MSSATSHNDDDFIRSLKQSNSFPLNIADKRESKFTRKLCHQRFNDPAANLCYDTGSHLISVPIHVFRPEHKRTVIKSLKDLRNHHGIIETPEQVGTSSPKMLPSEVTEDDPPCRMVFLHASSARSKLKISKIMLLELMTFHTVMPAFLDFVHVFGASENAKEASFSAFRQKDTLTAGISPLRHPLCLNRSGRGYELCYNMKTVDCKPDPKDTHKDKWDTHHLAVYHKFDVETGKALWIFIQGSSDIEDRVREVIGPDGRSDIQNFSESAESFASSLYMHTMLAQRASESWRWYVRWLETKCETETSLLMTEPREPKRSWRYSTERDPDDKRTVYTAKHLQDIQKLVEIVRDAAGAIDDNIDIITALARYYKGLASHVSFPCKSQVEANTSDFVRHLEYAAFELRRQHKRATTLARRADERRNLLMQYVNAQATETQERLTNSTYEVGLAAQKEAIVMRIITVVTLVFLPATFVSTFFGTDIVKYQGDDHRASWSSEAMVRWLQVTIPLTALTLLVAGIGYRYERKRQILKQHTKHTEQLNDPEKAMGKES